MIVGAWNLREFKALCLDLGLERLLFYTESLALKYNAAIYHKDVIQRRISELGLEFSLHKSLSADSEIAFELDALMAALNSMWDILGQLLNGCFIRPEMDTGKVTFNKVSRDYVEVMPSEIQSILSHIRGNHLYSTIKDYVDVSKHRHAIKGEVNVDFRETPTRVSYETQEFEYKRGRRHTLTPNEAFKCLEFVGESVDQIGAKIHEAVKLGNVT